MIPLCLLLWVVGRGLSRLTITNQAVLNSFKQVEVSYTTFPIGNFPFGRVLYGYLHYQIDNGCSQFQLKTSLNPHDISFFLILEDDGCEFSLKALNAQNADAEMLILITDKKVDNALVQANIHPTNQQIRIPILLVDKEVGENLKDLLRKYSDFILKYESSVPKNDSIAVEVFIDKDDSVFQ